MGSRMDKYSDSSVDNIPSRSVKNQELYKQVYNAYDEFENLVVPSNAKEIDLSNLKKEISSRDEYKKIKDYGDFTNNKIIRKEMVQEEQKKENEIYDINVLIKNAVLNNKEEEPVIYNESEDYLKKLDLDDSFVFEEDNDTEIDEELMKTANLSLEILSDLKGDNENTMVDAPSVSESDILSDTLIENDHDSQFYSGNYKFSEKDFDDSNSLSENSKFENRGKGNFKFFLGVFFCVFGILLVLAVVYLFLIK